jgi:DNA-binding transcriptional ArsR family regulator
VALEDFLGKTSEIKIIDFLSGNSDIAYNQSEISECTGISRQTVNHKIPMLLYNGIIEIKEKKKNVIYYQLADNNIIKALIGSVFANSFFVAGYENDEEDVIEDIRKENGPIVYEENACFSYVPETEVCRTLNWKSLKCGSITFEVHENRALRWSEDCDIKISKEMPYTQKAMTINPSIASA